MQLNKPNTLADPYQQHLFLVSRFWTILLPIHHEEGSRSVLDVQNCNPVPYVKVALLKLLVVLQPNSDMRARNKKSEAVALQETAAQYTTAPNVFFWCTHA